MRYLRSLGMCLVDPRSNMMKVPLYSSHTTITGGLTGGGVHLMHVTAMKYSTHLKSAFDTR